MVDTLTLRAIRDWTSLDMGLGDSISVEGQARVDAVVWPALPLSMSHAPYSDDPIAPPTVSFGTVLLVSFYPQVGGGTVAAGLNHLLVASDTNMDAQPMGPGGPTLAVRRGFQMFHRTCSADNPNQFESVPLDTTVDMVPVTAAPPGTATDAAYLAACGFALTPPDLGQRVPVSSSGPVQALAWAPAADTLYFLAGGSGLRLNTTVGSLNVASLAVATLFEGGSFASPMQVATAGTSLLLNEIPDFQPNLRRQPERRVIRLSLQRGAPLVSPVFSGLTPLEDAMLSPDGTTLAYYGDLENPDPTIRAWGLILLDLATGNTRLLAEDGSPLAWAPDGKALLVQSQNSYFETGGQLLPTDGSSAGSTVEGLPARLTWQIDDPCPTAVMVFFGANRHYFWTASGPQMLTQDCRGVQVQNLVTKQTMELVEPNRVAVVDAPIGVVASTDQVFAWAIQCFGIGETSCNAELRRMSLATGARDVVATANQALPFAVSPDGKTLATAAYAAATREAEIYLKPLAP
jgi:hypothetical protein